MKHGIHPTYYADTVVVCGTCGNTFHTGSTKKDLHLDICSNCHPFYTGEQRIVDTAGQVERFMKRASAKETIAKPVDNKKARRRAARGKTAEDETAQAPAEASTAPTTAAASQVSE